MARTQYRLVRSLTIAAICAFASPGIGEWCWPVHAFDFGEPNFQPAPVRLRDSTNREYLSGINMPYRDAPSLRSSGGALDGELEVRFANNWLDNDLPVMHRSYNGGLIGPTIRIKPGDILRLRLQNRLPENVEGTINDPNQPHGFNSTNLHTHGLHVSPEGRSDNVFVEVAPGKCFDFEYKIPADHPAGTLWYHAHKHGSVALQLSSGMAGALIVEGGIDELPAIKAARERVMVFQQVLCPKDGIGRVEAAQAYDDDPDPTTINTDTSINGVMRPTLIVAPGAVERWRMVHAGLVDTISVAVESEEVGAARVDLHEIAVDGLPPGTRRAKSVVRLQPGYRSDVMFQAPATLGTYYLINAETPATRSFRRRAQAKKYIAIVRVEGNPRPMALPEPNDFKPFALKPIADEEVQSTPRRTIEFSLGGGHGKVNGRPFDPDNIDIAPRVGTAEEWSISAAVECHPFHIHINPFEATYVDPDLNMTVREWRDTLFVCEGENPIRLRMRFDTFFGKTVLHCHNLRHEDRGMMMAFRIEPPANSAQTRAGVPLLSQAPRFALPDGNGTVHRFAKSDGRWHLLLFFRGTSCAHCLAQQRVMAEQSNEFAKRGITVVAVCPDSKADIKAATDNRVLGGRWPVLSDPEQAAFQAYGCGDRHGIFLLDRQGLVRWHRVGDTAFTDVPYLLQIIDALTEH